MAAPDGRSSIRSTGRSSGLPGRRTCRCRRSASTSRPRSTRSPPARARAAASSRSRSGLLRSMRQEEVEGVLAHEVAHIANGDMVTMTLLQGVINAFVMFAARVIAHFMTRTADDAAATAAGCIPDRHGAADRVRHPRVADHVMVLAAARVPRRPWRCHAGGTRSHARALRRLAANRELVDTRHQALATMKINGAGAGWCSSHPPADRSAHRGAGEGPAALTADVHDEIARRIDVADVDGRRGVGASLERFSLPQLHVQTVGP